jgi:hypothetical protein
VQKESSGKRFSWLVIKKLKSHGLSQFSHKTCLIKIKVYPEVENITEPYWRMIVNEKAQQNFLIFIQ